MASVLGPVLPAMGRPELPAITPVLPVNGKQQNMQNENGHIFRIWTPFSMILGSLDSQRKALQEYTEKHHSPSCEEEVTRREFDLTKRTRRKTLQHQKRNRIFMKFVFDELELGMEMNTSSKFSHG